MKKIILILLSIICSISCFSQDNEATQIAFKDIVANNPLTSGRVAAALTSIIKGKPNYIGAYTATGTNTYAASVVSSFTSYTKNDVFIINFTNANSGASTLNLNSVGAKTLVTNSGSALSSGDISANSYYVIAYDGTSLRIVGGVGSGGGGGSSTFVGLTDGPGAFTSKTLNYTRVNVGETALEYRTPSQVRADIGAGTGDGTVTIVAGTTNRITSSGGATPAIDISSSYVGQASITTLGTIGTGIWNGTAIGDSYISSASTWNGKQNSLTPTTVKTSNYTASANDLVPCDNTSGSFTVTLPTAPADKSIICVKLVTLSGSNTITVVTGGSDVFNKTGGATSLTLSLLAQAVVLQYKASGAIWYILADDIPLSQLDARFASRGVAQRSGTSIAFDLQATYGYSSPETGNITLNTTGFVEGTTQILIHNDSTIPTWPTAFKVIGGTYQVSQNNYFVMVAVKSTLILVTINQEI